MTVGLAFKNRCPKGRKCNFMHVFKNPNKRFPLQCQSPFVAKRNVETLSKVPSRIERYCYMVFSYVECLLTSNNFSSWDDDNGKEHTRHRHWRWSESPPNIETADRHRSVTSCASSTRRDHSSRSHKSGSSRSNSSHRKERSRDNRSVRENTVDNRKRRRSRSKVRRGSKSSRNRRSRSRSRSKEKSKIKKRI